MRQQADRELLVILLTVPIGLALEIEGIVLHVDYLQVLVVEPADVLDRVVHFGDHVLAKRKYVQLFEVLDVLDSLDLVRVQRQISELGERVKAFDFLDEVEREVEPGQVDHGLEAFDLTDDVVVELQLLQLGHAV